MTRGGLEYLKRRPTFPSLASIEACKPMQRGHLNLCRRTITVVILGICNIFALLFDFYKLGWSLAIAESTLVIRTWFYQCSPGLQQVIFHWLDGGILKIRWSHNLYDDYHKPLCGASHVNHTTTPSLSVPDNVLGLATQFSEKLALLLYCSAPCSSRETQSLSIFIVGSNGWHNLQSSCCPFSMCHLSTATTVFSSTHPRLYDPYAEACYCLKPKYFNDTHFSSANTI